MERGLWYFWELPQPPLGLRLCNPTGLPNAIVHHCLETLWRLSAGVQGGAEEAITRRKRYRHKAPISLTALFWTVIWDLAYMFLLSFSFCHTPCSEPSRGFRYNLQYKPAKYEYAFSALLFMYFKQAFYAGTDSQWLQTMSDIFVLVC